MRLPRKEFIATSFQINPHRSLEKAALNCAARCAVRDQAFLVDHKKAKSQPSRVRGTEDRRALLSRSIVGWVGSVE